MEKYIDARGLTCPKPVILAKKEMDHSNIQDIIIVEVDNEIAVENLRKLAGSQDAGYSVKKIAEKHYEVRMTVLKQGTVSSKEYAEEQLQMCQISEEKKTVVVFSSDVMGDGERELGEVLIKGFVYALTQLEKLPDTLLFYNKGAFLTCENSPVLEDLKVLEQEGVQIATCGTCLDYYRLKEKLRTGSVVNMYNIVEMQAKADRIIKP